MVFGMFSSQGTTPLVRLQTSCKRADLKNIVQDHVVPIIQNSGFDRATFMQDNTPCHKAKVVMSYLSEQDFEIMDWPPQSPNLNPIENLWKTLRVKVMERNPTYMEDLWVKLQEEWSKISIEDCQELIRSCSRRCALGSRKADICKTITIVIHNRLNFLRLRWFPHGWVVESWIGIWVNRISIPASGILPV